MEVKTDVIYARYSSELQRSESIQDQVRRCRDGLDRMGIDHDHFEVVGDEAVSGTLESRPGLDRVKALIRAGRLGRLVVTEQSRLTRGDNAKALIKDVVYQGGRFISISENIDTDKKGWATLVGINEIHHSRSNEDTAERVRGGQVGRVLDGDGSAGDFPYGYKSEYVDPAAALGYHGRGPKPRKHVVIDDAAAAVVREVFDRFAVRRESITAITRWLNVVRDQVPRIGRADWHHQHVRRMLTNTKYVGVWSFGKTTTVRDSVGKKKQVKARSDQRVTTVRRPHLRIIDQGVWDQVQAALAKLKTVYGMKPGHAKRGPAEHYRLLYPKTLLGGLVRCGVCGSNMIIGGSGNVKRMRCTKRRVGGCTMGGQLPLDKAEEKILTVFRDVLLGYPDWLAAVANEMRAAATELVRRVPDDLRLAQEQLAQTEHELDNLVEAVARGLNSPVVTKRLLALEQAKDGLTAKVMELGRVHDAHAQLPDDDAVRRSLAAIGAVMGAGKAGDAAQPQVVRVIREMLTEVVVEEVRIPGKRRGYARLRFRTDGWAAVRSVLGDDLPASVRSALKSHDDDDAGESFVIELGGPTRLDQLGPQIVAMRRDGVKWKEIARRTGLSLGNAYTAYNRIVSGGGQAAA